MLIDWRIPPTAPGWRGAVTRFMGPGKTRGEHLVEYGGQVLCTALIVAAVWRADVLRTWSAWQLAVAAIMVFDLVGGVLTNATNAAKRWYHRPAPGMRRYRMGFVAGHVLYPVAMAFVLLPGDWTWLLVNTVLLLGSAAAIELFPVELKRPTAMALCVSAVLANMVWLPLPAALAWFPVLFFLKLLVCFLVPEAPLTRRSAVR